MEDKQNFCRLCANFFEASLLLQIFQKTTTCSDSIDKIINMYMPFKVTTNDSLPCKVCKMCSASVIKWHRFVTSCVKAQKKLEKKWRNNDTFISSKSYENEERNSLNKDKCPSSTQLFGNQQIQLLGPVKSPVIKKKSTNYCIARWCNIGNESGMSLFRVPKDRLRALQWLAAADRMDLANKDMSFLHRCYLCATHFEKEMFVNEYCKSLIYNAIPSIFPKPLYADRIEQEKIKASVYPKELLGARLKYLLPKGVSSPQEAIKGSSSDLTTEKHSTPAITVLKNPEEILEQAGHIQIYGSIVQDDPSEHSSNILSDVTDPSKSPQSFNNHSQENFLGEEHKTFSIAADLNSRCLPDSISCKIPFNITTDVGSEWSPSDHQDLSEVSDNNSAFSPHSYSANQDYKDDTQVICRNIVCGNTVVEVADKEMQQKSPSGIPNTLINLLDTGEPYCEPDSATMLEMSQKRSNTGTVCSSSNAINFCEDQHETPDSFSLQVTASEKAFSLPCSIQPFQSTPIHDALAFGLKGPLSESDDLVCLNNMTGSQDFLLMHSSSSEAEHTQKQNVDNLCCTIVSESVSEPIVYEDRTMDAEVSARSIECTSPTHGQVIDGLIDLDHFLDST